jgi:endonuclease-3
MARKAKKKKAAASKTAKPRDKATGQPAARQPEMMSEAKRKLFLKGLQKTYRDARCSLDHESPIQLLVATILSAQCTDERVNKVTPGLFHKYAGPAEFAAAPREELEEDIRSTGFYRNKAKSIQGACRLIAEEHGGEVPDGMDDLLALPGVARKTASVVLGNAFNKAEGIVVDTHVARLSQRLGLTRNKTADKIERDLMEIVPRSRWIAFSHQMIQHGRRVCKARSPICPACPFQEICPSRGFFD